MVWVWIEATSGQGSVPFSDLLNPLERAGDQLDSLDVVGLKSSRDMLTRTVTHFCCDHGYKMSHSSSAAEDGESLRA